MRVIMNRKFSFGYVIGHDDNIQNLKCSVMFRGGKGIANFSTIFNSVDFFESNVFTSTKLSDPSADICLYLNPNKSSNKELHEETPVFPWCILIYNNLKPFLQFFNIICEKKSFMKWNVSTADSFEQLYFCGRFIFHFLEPPLNPTDKDISFSCFFLF